MIYEDRSSYDPELDPVGKMVLTVECAPGQIDSISDYLALVAKQAGVYSVEIGCDVHIPVVKVEVPRFDAPPEPEPIPEAEAAPVELIVDTPVVPEAPAAQEDAHAEPVPADPAAQGEVHGEQALEQPSLEPQAADVGLGREAGGSGESGSVDQRDAPVVAEPAGEVGAGSIERSP